MPAKKAKEKATYYSDSWYGFYGYDRGYGNSLSSNDYQSKSPLIGYGNVFRSLKPNEYFPKENYQLNMAMYLTVPYLFAGINLRAHYSLGMPFRFVDKDTDDTVEEIYLSKRSKFLGMKSLLFKTSIHMDVYGNAFWYCRYNDVGQTYDITMIQPERISIELNEFGEVEGYNVSYPDYRNRGAAYKRYWIEPEDMIHFKFNDLGETPWGYSLLQPMITLAEAKLEINKLMPILFKAYAKPYRHFKFTPPTDEQDQMSTDDIQATITDMVTKLNEEIEPDSDIVTGDAWDIASVSAQATGDPTKITEIIDEQMFASMGIPKFFFKPSGTTDLNINEANQWFKDQMSTRCEYVSEMITSRFTIPELETMFPDSANLPEMEFENRTISDENLRTAREMYREKIITLEEVRKEAGMEPLPEDAQAGPEITPDAELNIAVRQRMLAKAFHAIKDRHPETAEKWQDGEISDSELFNKAKLLR